MSPTQSSLKRVSGQAKKSLQRAYLLLRFQKHEHQGHDHQADSECFKPEYSSITKLWIGNCEDETEGWDPAPSFRHSGHHILNRKRNITRNNKGCREEVDTLDTEW